jgi:hypothetical protein
MQSACAKLYCHLWPVRLYKSFPHYIISGVIFGKKNVKYVFWFCLQILCVASVILRRIRQYIITYIRSCRSSRNVPVILVIFSKKSSNVNFYENMSCGSRVVTCGRTDGQTDRLKDDRTDARIDIHYVAISRFSQSWKPPKQILTHVEHWINVYRYNSR